MARAVASDRFIQVATARTEAAVQRALVATAQRKLAEIQATAKPTEITRFVDRVKDRPLSAVRPYGVIRFRFGYLRRIAEAALRLLEDTSPVDSGEYVESHALYADDKMVATPAEIRDARRVVIANGCAYARAVELGMWGRVPWSTQPQVPAIGVYKSAAAVLKRRFGHLADIRFSFAGADAGVILSGPAGNVSGVRFPALVLEVR